MNANAEKPCRILVIKPSSLGDIIQTVQVVEGFYQQCLKTQKPIEIHWIVRDCFAPLLRCSPMISKLFIFQRYGGLRAFWRLMKEVRTYRYDYVLDFQGLLRSGLMCLFAKGRYKVGRKDAREGAGLFYRYRFAPRVQGAHAVEILNALLKIFEADSFPARPVTFTLTEPLAVLKDIAYVAIFPSSRGPRKEWPYFRAYAEQLLSKTQLYCVWCGQGRSDNLPKHERFINLMGKTALEELPGLISGAQCVVVNDSGPLHLAAALCRPLIGIYGPTDSKRYGPYPLDDPKHSVFQASDGNLSHVSVEEVVDATMRLVNAK